MPVSVFGPAITCFEVSRMASLFRFPLFSALVLGAIYCVLSPAPVFAQADTSEQDNPAWVEELRTNLGRTLSAATGSPLQIAAVRETAMEGLIEIELDSGETLFSDRKGEFIVTGDLLQAADDGLINLSAQMRQEKIVDWIAAVPEEQMIIFEPEETKATITVFTDVDCPYCRKLHGEIKQINDLGIRVRYMAYPRGGLESSALTKMISVWCSADPARALTQAKHGQNVPTRECDNHVLEHYNLGNRIGITGTPALVLEDGMVLPGYLDAERLAAMVFGQ